MSQTPFFTYKGRPLVRSGNTIYYGSMEDSHVIIMQIMSSDNKKELDMATRVIIQLWLTDDELPLQERILKTSEKTTLYDAMDIAAIWLERALKNA